MDQVGAGGRVTTLVHFLHEVGRQWRIACMPGMTEFHATPYHPNYQRTDDTRAVSCPACKAAVVFKERAQALDDGLRRGVTHGK